MKATVTFLNHGKTLDVREVNYDTAADLVIKCQKEAESIYNDHKARGVRLTGGIVCDVLTPKTLPDAAGLEVGTMPDLSALACQRVQLYLRKFCLQTGSELIDRLNQADVDALLATVNEMCRSALRGHLLVLSGMSEGTDYRALFPRMLEELDR